MKKSDIYEIAIKILGLYLVIIIIGQLREVLMYAMIVMQTKSNPDALGGLNQTPIFITVVFSFLVLVAFTGLLLFRTKRLTRIICKKDDFEETSTLFTDKKTIYEIALTLTGLITLIWTLPDFAYQLKSYFQSLNRNSLSNVTDTGFLYISGIKILIAFLVIIYSKTISTYLATSKPQQIE